MTMTLVETIEVPSGGASSIEFTSIPQDADDLLLVVSGRGTTANSNMRLEFNSSTTGYTRRNLLGTGSSALSQNATNQYPGRINSSSTTASTFSNTSVYITNYASSVAKSASVDSVTENNATGADQELTAYSWSGTAAITSLLVGNFDNALAQYTTASLYKITKA